MTLSIPLFSFVTSIYVLISLLFVLSLSPFRLCFRSTSLADQLCELLVPALHVHERLVRAPKPRSRRSSSQGMANGSTGTGPSSSLSQSYSVPGLILVLGLSSFLSIGLILVTWTAVFFWAFAMILGDPEPDRIDGEKDDGRAAVLGVSNWWVSWLRKARKSP